MIVGALGFGVVWVGLAVLAVAAWGVARAAAGWRGKGPAVLALRGARAHWLAGVAGAALAVGLLAAGATRWETSIPPAARSVAERALGGASVPGAEEPSMVSSSAAPWRLVEPAEPGRAATIAAVLLAATAALAWGSGVLSFARGFAALARLRQRALRRHGRGRVRIGVSEELASAVAFAWGRERWVLLPGEVWADRRLRRVALAHEFAHLRQGDGAWRWIWTLVGTALPGAGARAALDRAWTRLEELACDERTAARLGRERYVEGILGAARIAAVFGKERAAIRLSTAMAPAGKRGLRELQIRLTALVAGEAATETGKHMQRRVWGAGVLVGAAGIAFGGGATSLARQGAEELARERPRAGELALDPRAQAIAEAGLRAAFDTTQEPRYGLVVVSDPRDGRVLAVAARSADGTPLPGGGLSLLVEPASLAKPFIAAVAVERGVTRIDRRHFCEEKEFVYQGRTYRDWRAFGWLTTAQTVEKSSNICGIKLALAVGARPLLEDLALWGFGPGGVASGIVGAAPGEFPGTVDENTAVTLATGMEPSEGGHWTVSPLEVVQAFGAIANGGRLLRPVGADARGEPGVIRRLISPERAREWREVLAESVRSGTGGPARSALVSTAGKTATAYAPENPDHPALGGRRNVSSFVGFAPVEAPEVLVYVALMDAPGPNVAGSRLAAPVFRQVVEAYLRK